MKVEKFFQKAGVDICNPKSMFNFLNEHFQYPTLNSWNRMDSIANCVKVHRMNLSTDCWVALKYLEAEEYFTVNDMIHDWEHEHPGYEVGFNGRSGGYLVLYNRGNYLSVIPEEFNGYDSYEDWKEDLKRYGYKVSDFTYKLRETVKLVQDFDRLCDELRAYVEQLGNGDFHIDQMENDVVSFNDNYADDLEYLGFSPLEADTEGRVDISEIRNIRSLLEAFQRMVDSHRDQGYRYAQDGNYAFLKEI